MAHCFESTDLQTSEPEDGLFYVMLKQAYERRARNGVDVVKIKRDKFKKLHDKAVKDLKNKCVNSACLRFYEILKWNEADEYPDEINLKREDIICYKFCFLYAYGKSTDEVERANKDIEGYVTRINAEILKKYPDYYFTTYLQMLLKYKEKEWGTCIYHGEQVKKGHLKFDAGAKIRSVQFFNSDLICELTYRDCCLEIPKVGRSAWYNYFMNCPGRNLLLEDELRQVLRRHKNESGEASSECDEGPGTRNSQIQTDKIKFKTKFTQTDNNHPDIMKVIQENVRLQDEINSLRGKLAQKEIQLMNMRINHRSVTDAKNKQIDSSEKLIKKLIQDRYEEQKFICENYIQRINTIQIYYVDIIRENPMVNFKALELSPSVFNQHLTSVDCGNAEIQKYEMDLTEFYDETINGSINTLELNSWPNMPRVGPLPDTDIIKMFKFLLQKFHTLAQLTPAPGVADNFKEVKYKNKGIKCFNQDQNFGSDKELFDYIWRHCGDIPEEKVIAAICKVSEASNSNLSTVNKQVVLAQVKAELFSTGYEERICSICLEDLTGTRVDKLICRHEFHFKCIGNWLKRNNECPNCRMIVVSS